MPKFDVIMPFAGYLTGQVEADDEESAIAKAMEWGFRIMPDVDSDCECDEVELLRHVTQGNICYAPCNEAHAEKADDDDEIKF